MKVGVSVVIRQMLVPITVVVRRQVETGAGVVTVFGS